MFASAAMNIPRDAVNSVIFPSSANFESVIVITSTSAKPLKNATIKSPLSPKNIATNFEINIIKKKNKLWQL